MNTHSASRIPRFLLDLSRWLRSCLAKTGKTKTGENRVQRRRYARAKMFKQGGNHLVSQRDMVALIQQDARKHEAFENAVRTGYHAKIERVRLGKGKNTLSGIRFEAAA